MVIGPPGLSGAVPVSETKGLEFDAVLVVEPDRILSDGPRGAAELYVALTRATHVSASCTAARCRRSCADSPKVPRP